MLSHTHCYNSDAGECGAVSAMQEQGQRGAAIAPTTVFLKDYDARCFAEKARCAVGGDATLRLKTIAI